jgi:hypothetical protein
MTKLRHAFTYYLKFFFGIQYLYLYTHYDTEPIEYYCTISISVSLTYAFLLALIRVYYHSVHLPLCQLRCTEHVPVSFQRVYSNVIQHQVQNNSSCFHTISYINKTSYENL